MAPVCPQCGREVSGLDREVTFGAPDEVFALTPDERVKRVVQPAKSFLLLDGDRCFLRVLLPVTLDVGQEFRFGVWIEVAQTDFKRVWTLWDDAAYATTAVDGNLSNTVPPWGTAVLGAACHAAARNTGDTLYIDKSSNLNLNRILATPWSTHECEQLIQRFWGE
jgi:hypothetical protein